MTIDESAILFLVRDTSIADAIFLRSDATFAFFESLLYPAKLIKAIVQSIARMVITTMSSTSVKA
jgi:hypothetical protein